MVIFTDSTTGVRARKDRTYTGIFSGVNSLLRWDYLHHIDPRELFIPEKRVHIDSLLHFHGISRTREKLSFELRFETPHKEQFTASSKHSGLFLSQDMAIFV
jgi:hypothetical protein